MTTQLLPCPFCGTTEGLYPSYRWPGSGAPYAIDCVGCGFDFVPREGADVIAHWNSRHDGLVPPTVHLQSKTTKEYSEFNRLMGEDKGSV